MRTAAPPAEQKQFTLAAAPPPRPRQDVAPLWLQRASLTLLVATCIYLGLLLLVLPWTRYWQDNRFFAMMPERVTSLFTKGAARGVASGLGLLDIWIGISEVTHRRRHTRPEPRP